MIHVYDAINTSEHNIPLDAPGFGYYVDGRYAWTQAQIDKRPNAKRFSITAFGNPLAQFGDCENGDMTPAQVSTYAHRRHALGFLPGLYGSKSTQQAIAPLVADIPHAKWTADPDGGVDHMLAGDTGTQWGWMGIFDISTFVDSYFQIGVPQMTPQPASLTAPCIDFQLTPSGKGYWLFGADGGVFTYGDAGFYGSASAVKLTKPIIAARVTPSGKGYYLIGGDYGVFTYGDAVFLGHPGPFVG